METENNNMTDDARVNGAELAGEAKTAVEAEVEAAAEAAAEAEAEAAAEAEAETIPDAHTKETERAAKPPTRRRKKTEPVGNDAPVKTSSAAAAAPSPNGEGKKQRDIPEHGEGETPEPVPTLTPVPTPVPTPEPEPEKRRLTMTADGITVAKGCRIHVRGRANMSMDADFWQVDVYNLPENDLAVIRDAKKISVGGESLTSLCEGKAEDIYPHSEQGKDVTTILLADCADFCSSLINLAVAAGATVEETLRGILQRCTSPIPLMLYAAQTQRLIRGQAFCGRTTEAVRGLVKSVKARSYVTRGGMYVIRQSSAAVIMLLAGDDLKGTPSDANGAIVVRTSMKGWPVGQMVQFKDYARPMRIIAQAIDADSFEGPWMSELVLLNETDMNEAQGNRFA